MNKDSFSPLFRYSYYESNRGSIFLGQRGLPLSILNDNVLWCPLKKFQILFSHDLRFNNSFSSFLSILTMMVGEFEYANLFSQVNLRMYLIRISYLYIVFKLVYIYHKQLRNIKGL